MDDQKISNCEQCNTPFVPKSPDQTLCLACDMQPANISVSEMIGDHIISIYSKSRLVKAGAESEVLDSGLSGRLDPAKAHHYQMKKHRPSRFKQKNCEKCKEKFFPSGARSRLCSSCDLTPKQKKARRVELARRNRANRKNMIILNETACAAIKKASKQYGLSESTVVIEAIKYLDESYRIPPQVV